MSDETDLETAVQLLREVEEYFPLLLFATRVGSLMTVGLQERISQFLEKYPKR